MSTTRRFPAAKQRFDYAHLLPGDTRADYQPSTVPWAMVPQHVDPAFGFLINANNSPFQAAGAGSELSWTPRPIRRCSASKPTPPTARSARWSCSARHRGTEPELEAIKYDTGVSRNSWTAHWYSDIAPVDPRSDGRLAAAQALLARWNWNFDGRHPGQALAAPLMRTGQKGITSVSPRSTRPRR